MSLLGSGRKNAYTNQFKLILFSVRCEANHLPTFSAEVNNTWRYTYTPPYVCMV
jgi:hypothetical protein